MTLALSTEGFIPDSVVVNAATVIVAVSPTPNTTPGAAGGMSADYAVAKNTPIVISITDADGAPTILYTQVTAVFLDGSAETVYRNGTFTGQYITGSSQSGITNGYSLSIKRTSNWPGDTGGGNLAVGLLIDAVDTGNDITSVSFYYEMPKTTASVPVTISVAPSVGTLDHVAGALSRLPEQFRAKTI